MMRKNERKIWIGITSFLFLALIFVLFSNPLGSMGLFSTNSKPVEKLNRVLEIVKDNYYIDPGTDDDLIVGAAKGIVQTLGDPYSYYYTEEEIKARLESLKGKFGGIGAWVGFRDGYTTIIKPIKGFPAYKAGLMPHDKIIEVDGVNVVGKTLEETISLLKGDPGTEVNILIKRDGVDEPILFTLTRAVIEIPFVRWDKMDNDVAYIKIEQFGDKAFNDMKEALEDIIDNKQMKGMIIDLRGNPGGYLDVVLDILDLFFDKKLLVYTKGRNKVFNKRYYSSEPKFVPDDVKIVILVDEGSASASEIFTGVMKDYKRATIIGTRTYGKGLVQQIFNLPDHSAIILTVSQYFTPDGYQINKNGIEPDIIVKEYELSENDKFKITILMRENYIKDFVSKYGKNYTDNDFNKFKAFLMNKNLLVDDFILRKMIFNEIHRDDVDLLYTLEYDLQLKAAYKEIKKELSE